MYKEKLSKKKLKNPKNMLFVKRTYSLDTYNRIKSVHDYFFHTVKQITVIRSMVCYYGVENLSETFIHWTCPELGRGNSSLKYWLSVEKSSTKKEVYHEDS